MSEKEKEVPEQEGAKLLDMEAVEEAPGQEGAVLLDLEAVEAALRKEQYRHSYGRVLRSTVFSLIVVAAVAVLVAVLVLPVLQISGTSMTDALWACSMHRPDGGQCFVRKVLPFLRQAGGEVWQSG